MKNYQADSVNLQLDREVGNEKRFEFELQWIEVLRSELLALKRLERFETERGNYTPLTILDEIQRRRNFLDELLT